MFFYVFSLLIQLLASLSRDPNLLNGGGSMTSPFIITIKHTPIKRIFSLFLCTKQRLTTEELTAHSYSSTLNLR